MLIRWWRTSNEYRRGFKEKFTTPISEVGQSIQTGNKLLIFLICLHSLDLYYHADSFLFLKVNLFFMKMAHHYMGNVLGITILFRMIWVVNIRIPFLVYHLAQAEQWVNNMSKSSVDGKSTAIELEGRPARSVHLLHWVSPG